MPRRNPDEVNEAWVVGLLVTPTGLIWRRVRVWRKTVFATPAGHMQLVLKRRRGNWVAAGYEVLWYVLDGQGIIAAGTAKMDDARDGVLEFGSTAVAPTYRRQGIYRAILAAMRKMIGQPIESDGALTPGARKAWRYAGGVEALRNGAPVMRVNPAQDIDEKFTVTGRHAARLVWGWREGPIEWQSTMRIVIAPTGKHPWTIREAEHGIVLWSLREWSLRKQATVIDVGGQIDLKTGRFTTSDKELRSLGIEGYLRAQQMAGRLAELLHKAKR